MTDLFGAQPTAIESTADLVHRLEARETPVRAVDDLVAAAPWINAGSLCLVPVPARLRRRAHDRPHSGAGGRSGMSEVTTEIDALRAVQLAAGNALSEVRDPIKRRALRKALDAAGTIQLRDSVAAAEAAEPDAHGPVRD